MYISLEFTSVHREATEAGIKQISDYSLKYYKINEDVHKTDDGFYFDLKTEIDLSKPDYTYSWQNENVYGLPNDEFVSDKETFGNVDSAGTFSAKPSYSFSTKQNNFLIIVDLFWD